MTPADQSRFQELVTKDAMETLSAGETVELAALEQVLIDELPSLTEITDTELVQGARLFAVRSDGLSFLQCVEAALDTPELIAQVDRLYGTTLVSRKAPIEKMVDDATGKSAADMQTLLRFIWNCVFLRCGPIK